MDKRNTRQEILDAALELFSRRGFDGVSVKDIAHAVGIKDSSLYKHFKSKRDIFDTLVQQIDEKFEHAMALYRLPQGDIAEIAREYGRNDLTWLKKACKAIFDFFVNDVEAARIRRMLMLEQIRSPSAAKTFREWFMDSAIEFQTALFTEMIAQGYFRAGNPRAIALEFYAPFYMLICQYDSMPGKEDEAFALLMEHIEQFASTYQIRNEE